jgi:chaperonin GroEL
MNKEIQYSQDARKQLLSGVEIIAKAVKTTLGPSGRNVLIRNKGENRPFSTKDGVTVAGQVSSDNPIEQVAIESLQDIANITDEGAGDGTTTATVLAEAILVEGLKDIDNYNLFDVKRGIEETMKIITDTLEANTVRIDSKEDVEKLREVAMISSNYDKEIADVVFDAFGISGRQGIVNIKRSKSFDTYVKSIEGMTLPVGYISKFYANNAEGTCILEKPWVYITNQKINKVGPNLDYFLATAAARNESVLIMCAGVDPAVSEMFIRNAQQGAISLCVTRNPGFGNEQEDLLHDLGIVLGAKPFIENEGLPFEEINQEDLFDYIPRSKEVTITEHVTSFMEPYVDTTRTGWIDRLSERDEEGNVISAPTTEEVDEAVEKAKAKRDNLLSKIAQDKEDRADKLRDIISETHTQYEKSQLQTRISRLADGIAFINIGAKSTTEFLEKQARVQDALYAVKSAYQEGIVPGGGSALFSISHSLELDVKNDNASMRYGSEVLMRAIKRPMMQIIENVGVELSEQELDEIGLDFRKGYNARTRKIADDMIAEGVIDPKKVTRVALESAVSVASMVLTTECVIVDKDVYESQKNQF